MIIRLADMDDAVVIDFRETAPGATSPSFFNLDENNRPSTMKVLLVESHRVPVK